MQSVYNVFGIFFNDSAYIYIKGTTTGKHFFFFGNPAVCEIDPQEVNLTLSVYLMGLQIPETAGLQKKTCL